MFGLKNRGQTIEMKQDPESKFRSIHISINEMRVYAANPNMVGYQWTELCTTILVTSEVVLLLINEDSFLLAQSLTPRQRIYDDCDPWNKSTNIKNKSNKEEKMANTAWNKIQMLRLSA